MKIEVVLLAKNHYNMEGNKGATVLVYGENEVTNNRSGISISNASIEYNQHEELEVFPGRYSGEATFVGSKNKSGKEVTTLKLSKLQLIEELDFIAI